MTTSLHLETPSPHSTSTVPPPPASSFSTNLRPPTSKSLQKPTFPHLNPPPPKSPPHYLTLPPPKPYPQTPHPKLKSHCLHHNRKVDAFWRSKSHMVVRPDVDRDRPKLSLFLNGTRPQLGLL
ncbi:hypothetical protein LIER_33688 [Lithospermum erythrorhizon]|uniref:Uncharacterized protein n=1 Tax=Lithospermum erythrorhizon TaxID=34254 RepID=A0AAV3RZX5_LITER